MKSKICIVYILSFLSVVGAGVKAADNTPFIKGYLKNCNNEKVYIAYEDTKDSVQTNKDGYFYYLASNIKRASIVTLIVPGRISPNFYLAPGFKLSIKSDATSQKNFYDSLQLTGIGSVSNLYFKYFYLLQSKRTPSPLSDGWYNIKFGSFANDGLGKLQLDSFTRFVSDSIFGPKNKEPNHETFKTLSEKHTFT